MMKLIIIHVFILLSLISYTYAIYGDINYSDKCTPCVCTRLEPLFYNYAQQYYTWRNNKERWRLFVCPYLTSPGLMSNIPWEADRDLEAIYIYTEPFCRNTYGVLQKSMFQRFNNLQLLACKNCEATSIEQDILSPHRNTLKEIYFGFNGIRVIPVSLHQHAAILEIADWRNSPIEVIYAGTYANLQYLKWTCHHKNRLKTIEIGAFRNLPSLQFVGLGFNMLTFVDVLAFDNYNFAGHEQTSVGENRFFCNKDLCPFMEKMESCGEAFCYEPIRLSRKHFKQAILYIGTNALQVRHKVDYGEPVRMSCTACSSDKLQWQKVGTGAIGQGSLPPGCSIQQVEGSHITKLVIEKVLEEHDGNYSCFSPKCVTADCPIPVISLTVNLIEPVWNFTRTQGKIDKVVRYGSAGLVSGLLPLFIYSIVMAVSMSIYLVYHQIKKNQARQQQLQH